MANFNGKINKWPPIKEEKFKEEVFDLDKGFERVKSLSGAERKKEFGVFLKKYFDHVLVLSKVMDKLERFISINKKLDKGMILDGLKEINKDNKINLTNKELKFVNEFSDLLLEDKKNIDNIVLAAKELVNKKNSAGSETDINQELYKMFFNSKPKGKIRAHSSMWSIYFLVDDPRDFNFAFHGKEELSANSAGFARIIELSKLNIPVFVISKGYPNLINTAIHEKQHLIFKAFLKIYKKEHKLPVKMEIKPIPDFFGEIKSSCDRVIDFYNKIISSLYDSAKSEILAYLKDEKDMPISKLTDVISNYLKENKKDGGSYDYFENAKIYLSSGKISDDRIFAEKSKFELVEYGRIFDYIRTELDRIKNGLYFDILDEALGALDFLYSRLPGEDTPNKRNQVAYLLMPVPLEKWLDFSVRLCSELGLLPKDFNQNK